MTLCKDITNKAEFPEPRGNKVSKQLTSADIEYNRHKFSLPSAAQTNLEKQLDWDNEENEDLNEMAHYMEDWDSKLATHLKLTEVDTSYINHKYSSNTVLQSQEALKIWKGRQMPQATYGNLLQVFVDAGQEKCAEALCMILRKRCVTALSEITKDNNTLEFNQQPLTASNYGNYVLSLPPAVRPLLEKQLDWQNNADEDLKEIAHNMEDDWNLKLATHLELSEMDTSEINHHASPVIQRQEALKKWKNKQLLQATYGNLLEAFVNGGQTQCAEALCEVLRRKFTNVSTEDSAMRSKSKNNK